MIIDPEPGPASLSIILSLIWAGLSALIALSLIVVRHLAYRWVKDRLLSPDREVYDKAWQEILCAGSNTSDSSCDNPVRQELKRIANITTALTAHIHSSKLCLQRQHAPLSLQNSEQPGLLRNDFRPDYIEKLAPAKNLKLLLSQASVASIFLRSKASQWALLCGAKSWAVPAHMPNSAANLISWTEISTQESNWRVKWTRPKKAIRAQEKLARAYGGTVARLVDLCRETLVFESPSDLAKCLEMIKQDSEIHIVRVKNRLDTCFDATWSAGFRYVRAVCIIKFVHIYSQIP